MLPLSNLAFQISLIVGTLTLAIGIFIGKRLTAKTIVIDTSEKPVDAVLPSEQNNNLDQRLKMLEEVLHDAAEGTIVTNLEGIVIWANRRSLEILNTSWSFAGNNHISKILPTTPQENAKNDFKIKLTSLEGAAIFVSVKIFPLNGVNLDIKGKIYIIWDATESVALEEMKLDFVAIAAHQLRTPLTSIRGYLSFLTESIMPKINDDEKKYLQRLTISTNRLASLIENLMNISQIEKGHLKLDLKPIHLEEVVKQTVDLLSETARQANITLTINNLIPPYPNILGDSSLLGVAISNVIANGIKYNNLGGDVSVTLQRQDDGVTVHVADHGKGISTEAQNHLFQSFYQATSSLSELSNGLGLGLYVAKSIIDAHHGRIWINSMVGKGTTVSIFLPASKLI